MRFYEFTLLETDRLAVQKSQVEDIKIQLNQIKGSNTSIKLKVGDREISAAGLTYVPTKVHADTAIVNEEGTPVAWISLKGLSFRWSGYVELLASSTDHEWLDIFIEDVKNITKGQFRPGESLRLDKISDDLEKSIMYGKNYGSDDRGLDNVDAVLIGKIQIVKEKDYYIFKADKVYNNGESPSPNHRVIVNARYSSSDNNAGIKNCRLEAEPGIIRNSLPIDTSAQVKTAMEEFHSRREGKTAGLRQIKTRVEKPLTPPYPNLADALDKLTKYLKRFAPDVLKNYGARERETALQTISGLMRKYNITPQMAINKWKSAEIYQENKKYVSSKRR